MTPVDSLFERDFHKVIKQTRVYPLPKRKLAPAIPKLVHSDFSISPPPSTQNYIVSPRKYCIIARIFYPIILACKIIGICPVKILKSEEEGLRFQFNYISAPFIRSSIVLFADAVILIYWVSNALLEIDGPFGIRIFRAVQGDGASSWLNESLFNGSQIIVTVNLLTKLTLPVGAWVLAVLQSTDVAPLCHFLNDWSKFLCNYESSFLPYYSHNFEKTLKFRLIFFSIAWTIPLIALLLTLKPFNFLHIPGLPYVGIVFAYFQIIYVLGTRALSYLRDMMLLRTLTAAYQEILEGMKAEYASCGKSITKGQVTAWVDLISFTRVQAARVESYISLPNLWSIFEVFTSVLLMLSMMIFLFMNNSLGASKSSNFLAYSSIYTAFFTTSLIWKTKLAEKMSGAEEAIAEEVIEMDTADDDFETRLEMKQICDLIYNDPVKIRVGNMLVLNKRLVLAFFGQLASYLVVILQFTKS